MSDRIGDVRFQPVTALALFEPLEGVRNLRRYPCRRLKKRGRLNQGKEHDQQDDQGPGDDGQVYGVRLSHSDGPSRLHKVKTLGLHTIERYAEHLERFSHGMLHRLRTAHEIFQVHPVLR
jgi:hypothetical protein